MAIYPLSAYYTTTLTPRITSYELLADRILRQLGAPLINLEVVCSTVYDHIGQAVEWYTKYAGHTQEYLIFDSKMYQKGVGIRLDQLFSITPEEYKTDRWITTTTTTTVSTSATSGISVTTEVVTVSTLTLSADTFSATSVSSVTTTSTASSLTDTYVTTATTLTSGASAIFDYDLNNYRKVKAVQAFTEGTNKGINTLFTIEQSLAQQTQFAYGLGNYGFDLVTWEIMKQWLEMRERVLALKAYIRFNPDTQYMRILPEPDPTSQYFALVECTVEKPIKHLIKERWIFQYALALTKITIANVRGKFSGTALFGGGSLNATDLMTQGLQEKEKLEQELMYQAGEADPCPFFIG